VIEIQELYKYYGDRRAIGPLSIEIGKGEIVGLLGLNGAGKTTTLRILACDLLPTSGTVKVGGSDVVADPDTVRSRVGYLPDRPPLYDDMTVDEYLSFTARLRRVSSASVAKSVSDVLELTELGSVRSQLIGTLSHGFRQRVGIAQAIVHRPEVVVLDEPISGLDPVQIVEMRKLVRGLRGAHTVIVSSHILSEISETCDRLLVIQDGRIAWIGSEQQLFAEFGQSMQLTVTVRGASAEQVSKVLKTVSGVLDSEAVPPSEPGEGIVTLRIGSNVDVREAVSRALVQNGISLLELVRRHGLENMVLKLLGGDVGESRPSAIPGEARRPPTNESEEA